MGIVPISVGYIQPGLALDIGISSKPPLSATLLIYLCLDADAFNAYTESLFGYPTYGYWPWHNTEDAVKDCDEHVSFASSIDPKPVFLLMLVAAGFGFYTPLCSQSRGLESQHGSPRRCS